MARISASGMNESHFSQLRSTPSLLNMDKIHLSPERLRSQWIPSDTLQGKDDSIIFLRASSSLSISALSRILYLPPNPDFVKPESALASTRYSYFEKPFSQHFPVFSEKSMVKIIPAVKGASLETVDVEEVAVLLYKPV